MSTDTQNWTSDSPWSDLIRQDYLENLIALPYLVTFFRNNLNEF